MKKEKRKLTTSLILVLIIIPIFIVSSTGINSNESQRTEESFCITPVDLVEIIPINTCIDVNEEGNRIVSFCEAGGPGSGSCSFSDEGISCSASCLIGWYSCCGPMGCYCEQEIPRSSD